MVEAGGILKMIPNIRKYDMKHLDLSSKTVVPVNLEGILPVMRRSSKTWTRRVTSSRAAPSASL